MAGLNFPVILGGGSSQSDRIISPDTINTLIVDNDTLEYYDGNKLRMKIGNTTMYFSSQNSTTDMFFLNSAFFIKKDGIRRLEVNSTNVFIHSPDKLQELKVENSGIFYNNSELITELDKGATNGIAELINGIVPTSQLPAYVSDIVEYATYAALVSADPQGTDVLYITLDDGKLFRWTGSAGSYAEISSTIVLGTTSATAYRGDHGLIAYTHANLAHAPSDANNYIHPTGDGNLHVPANGVGNVGKVLTAGVIAGDYSWETAVLANADRITSGDTLKDLIITDTTLIYADGTRNRVEFTAVHTKLLAPDGDYTLIDNARYVYNDGTRNRLEVNSSGSMLVSPDGTVTVIVSDAGVLYNLVEVATVDDLNSNWDTAYGWGNHANTYSLLNHNHDADYSTLSHTHGSIASPDTLSSLVLSNTELLYNTVQVATVTDLHANDMIISPDTVKTLTASDIGLIYNDGTFNRLGITNVTTILVSPDGNNSIHIDDTGAYYNGVELGTVVGQPGTVISSVSWNANTTTSGEATIAYKKNHLSAYRLAPGIWSIENEGTNPLMPGDSADWVTNSLGGGIGDPFFLAEMNIIAFGQPSVGHPVTMTISAKSTTTSPNTGNLGSMIIKIRDKDGVVSDPTLSDAYATVKLTYIV